MTFSIRPVRLPESALGSVEPVALAETPAGEADCLGRATAGDAHGSRSGRHRALDPEGRVTLTRLLRAELEPLGLSLVERDPSGGARTWAREVATGERHLLAALLDTKAQGSWRLVVIDTARGRAISRASSPAANATPRMSKQS